MSNRIDISGMGYRSAFHAWFHHSFKDSPGEGAEYLLHCVRQGDPDNLVWEFLNRTGDETYSQESFVKAAQIILSEAFRKEDR